MSKKQDRSSVGDVPSCSPKFVCPVSFVCLLICTAALVRVEIINQRVHHVENVIAEVRQMHESIIKDSSEEASFQDSGRTGSVGNFDSNISKESKDMIEGNFFPLINLQFKGSSSLSKAIALPFALCLLHASTGDFVYLNDTK